jgi:hypothetical protein
VIIAFDLDGTLCNIEHRLHFIQSKPKDWPAFFRACVDDTPVWPMINLARHLPDGWTIEVWSGRSDEVREQTMIWLARHGLGNGYISTLRMRKAGDYRADNIVKGEWFDALPVDQRPALAFDDRQQVVDMWRSRGVICCQVAPGDF